MSAVPFIKFYPSDWLSEESLRLVSFAARGLWIDLLCLMAKNERRGFLEVKGGVNPTLAQLGKLVGATEAEIMPLLEELKAAGTCSVEPETGVLFSRRMVRDTAHYNQAVSFGKKGGNPTLKTGLRGRVKGSLNLNGQPSLGSNMGSISSVSKEGGAGGNQQVGLAESIYEAYPRKQGRADALKAIRRALQGDPRLRDNLLTRVQAYAAAVATWPEAERCFVPHPATWFNRGSYDDDPATWQRKTSTEGASLFA